jgi:hypothetical protein
MLAERIGGLAGLIAVIVSGLALYNVRQSHEQTHQLLDETRSTLDTFKNAYDEQQTNLDVVRSQVKAAREETVRLERELAQVRSSAQPTARFQPERMIRRRDKPEAPRKLPVIVGPVTRKPVTKRGGIDPKVDIVKLPIDGGAIQLGGNEKVILNDQKAFLGITPMAVDKAIGKRLKYPEEFGLWIVKVSPGQPAHNAGIQANDVLMRINEATLKSSAQLEKILAGKRPGEAVSLDLFRNGREFPLKMELGSRKR